MRAVHWVKLPAASLSTSVWATLDASSAPLDEEATQALFAARPPPPKRSSSAGSGGGGGGGGGGAGGGGEGGGTASGGGVGGVGPSSLGRQGSGGGGGSSPRGATLHVLGVKRANNVGIFLKKVLKGKAAVTDFCASVRAFEPDAPEP